MSTNPQERPEWSPCMIITCCCVAPFLIECKEMFLRLRESLLFTYPRTSICWHLFTHIIFCTICMYSHPRSAATSSSSSNTAAPSHFPPTSSTLPEGPNTYDVRKMFGFSDTYRIMQRPFLFQLFVYPLKVARWQIKFYSLFTSQLLSVYND